MINRRSLLISAGCLGVSTLLASCSQNEQAALTLELLQDAIPAQVLAQFERQTAKRFGKIKLNISQEPQVADLFQVLQQWRNLEQDAKTSDSPSSGWLPTQTRTVQPANWLSLGDAWLTAAIQQKLIQPIQVEPISAWSTLPERWQSVVQRNTDGGVEPQGQVWGVPYRWGSLAIVFRREAFEQLGWQPTSWADLWNPELQQRLALPDHARAVIGIALKKLGKSVNATNLKQLPELETEMKALHQQVKFYSSDAYLQPLMLGDIDLAVGWSTDIVSLLRRDRRFAGVVPSSGSMLTADIWVQPVGLATLDTAIVEQAIAWVNYCLQPEVALQLSLLSSAASPMLQTLERANLPKTIQLDQVLLPDPEVVNRSEFLLPLPPSAIKDYETLWINIRQERQV